MSHFFINRPIFAMVLSILINWLAARAFVASKQKSIVTAAVIANLAVLGVFKYSNFVSYNLGLVLGRPMPQLDIVLPLGISFFTFHHIMYLVDLRRGKAPLYPLGRYALYISFFPQAIAGPLARWSEVMHQFGRQVYAPGWQRQFCLAIAFIATGLFEKIFLGDRLAGIIDPVYAQAAGGPVTNGDAWLALSFNIQILYDFAGYSDIAIGLGLLFGVQLPFNFNAPFRSTSIQDFWQRWHITLMMFLRDYVFHPLANARILPRRLLAVQYFGALLLTMALCGLWHGANFTFVLWGALQGMAIMLAIMWSRYVRAPPALIGWAATFGFVVTTSVFFRSPSLGYAFEYLGTMFSLRGGFPHVGEQALSSWQLPSDGMGELLIVTGCLALLALHWLEARVSSLQAVVLIWRFDGTFLRMLFAGAAIWLLLLPKMQDNPFIYFRF